MAILKHDGYSNWSIVTGDDTFDSDMDEQLKVSTKELAAAINAENVTDQLFSRILTNRSKAHKAMMEKVPGVK